MPNALTHYYFSKKLLARLPESIKTLIEGREEAYYFASMGPDVLYGLKFGKDKVKANYGEDVHASLVREVFSVAKDTKLNAEQLAFVLGQLAHYSLDHIMHAYVYDYEFNRLPPLVDEDWHKDLHMLIEASMDKYVCEKLWDKPDIVPSKLFNWGSKNQELLLDYFTRVIRPVFMFNLSRFDAMVTARCFQLFVNLCNEGGIIKKKVSEFAQKYLGGAHLFTAGYRKRTPKEWDILNLNRKPFNLVAEESGEPCNETFDETFERALNKGVEYLTDFINCRESGKELKNKDEGFYIVNYDARRL